MKFVKCIDDFNGYSNPRLFKNKIYRVFSESIFYYRVEKYHAGGWGKGRFIELQLNKKIANILYGGNDA